VDAQYNAGMTYAEGAVVKQDMQRAAQWFEKAANQGLASAQSTLGFLYANGQGVAADPARAVQWFERSAKQGYTLAQSNLASLYTSGQGVAKNPQKAYFWLLVARDKDASLEARTQAAGEALAPAERLRIQREARSWKPVREPG